MVDCGGLELDETKLREDFRIWLKESIKPPTMLKRRLNILTSLVSKPNGQL